MRDRAKINLKSGNGGHGAVAFTRVGKPDGGNGGPGGDVYLQANSNILDLKSIDSSKLYKAENGVPGGNNNKTGGKGKDLVLSVPEYTKVYDSNSKFVTMLTKSGSQIKLLTGGRGGLGNHYFRKGQRSTLNKFTYGKQGMEFHGFLEFELQADVVFIGLPNAGKSSMLNALTHANVKTAPYPFTTLDPNIAISEEMTLLDLPGLIEGTKSGKGLGTNFLKHAKSARLIAHFISLDGQVSDDYQLIRKELADLETGLAEKEELIVLTKSDLVSESDLQEKIFGLQAVTSSDIVVTSQANPESIVDLKKHFQAILKSV